MSGAACRVCGSANVVLWRPRTLTRPLVASDLRVTDAAYGRTLTLWRCRRCSFGFADADELRELSALYEHVDDEEYAATQDTRTLQMRGVLRAGLEAQPLAHGALDVGAGAGALLAEASRLGLVAVGVEPNATFVQLARAAAPDAEVLQGTFPHPALVGRVFDLVFVVDVIEHVAEPVALLAAAARALAPGGALVVVTPDCASVAARRLRDRWWHLRVAHVGYFQRASLEIAARRAGLVVQTVQRPVWYFRVRHLTQRATAYLPALRAVNAVAGRLPPLRWLYERVVPVNLGDSMLAVLRHDPGLAAPRPAAAPQAARAPAV